MTVNATNRLLAELGRDAASFLITAGHRLDVAVNRTPHAGDADQQSVYFPVTGLVSVLRSGDDGRLAETDVVGSDGAVGFVEALGGVRAAVEFRGLLSGQGWLIPASALRALVAGGGAPAQVAWRYAGELVRDGRQATACRAMHGVRARLANTLVDYAERTGGQTRLRLTHEVLSWSVAVCRTTITTLLGELADEGMIMTSRGLVTILDWDRLDHASCGCRQDRAANPVEFESRPPRPTYPVAAQRPAL
jgi:CRP-like cAMP-binding protein